MQHRTNATAPKLPLHGLRVARGFTQADVAQHVNKAVGRHVVTADMVGRWERGDYTPLPHYRRALAEVFGVTIADLGLDAPRPAPARPSQVDTWLVPDDSTPATDPRVTHSRDEWRTTRRALNTRRPALSRVAADLYPQHLRLGGTGLLAQPEWIPAEPVDLAAVKLEYDPDPPAAQLDGTEPASAHVRACASLGRPYQRYTHAIRDIDHPRLFDNRPCWRLLGLEPYDDGARMTFGPTTYFAGIDIHEAVAHDLAYVHLTEGGIPKPCPPAMRDLPLRRLIGDPFALHRRPVLTAIGTLLIRHGPEGASFLLHRRDARNVAVAGGMLQVIPSGVFQPSSVMPSALDTDFDLWRNISREYSEELLGNPEHDGDGAPASYDREPFTTLDQARGDGSLRVWYLGTGLDGLTLFGEILTVAVVDADTFDDLSRDFVGVNDEGTVIGERLAFTEDVVGRVLASGRVAPAGAGCLELAWRHRELLLDSR